MSNKSDRINKIVSVLRIHSNITIKELAQLLHVSEMTIRRDVTGLQKTGMVKKVNGLLLYIPEKSRTTMNDEYNLTEEMIRRNYEKDQIGRFAASLVEPDDIIIIDSGTTTEMMAQYILDNLNITVLCYSTNILFKLYTRRGFDFIFPGGYYHPNTQMFEFPGGIDLIKQVRANKVFLSAAGIHEKLGLTYSNSYEVPTGRAILESSLQKILLADSSKFGVIRQAYFAQLDEIDIVITDEGISDEWRKIINDHGITLHVV